MSENPKSTFIHSHPIDDLARNFLQRMLDHLPVALFCKDARNDFQNVFWNSTAVGMFGYSAVEVVGKTDFEIYPREEAEAFRKIDQETMKSGETYYVPEEVLTIGGSPLYLRTWKIPLYGEDGGPQWLLGITQDITELKRIEQIAKLSSTAQIAQFASLALEKINARDIDETKRLLKEIERLALTTPRQ